MNLEELSGSNPPSPLGQTIQRKITVFLLWIQRELLLFREAIHHLLEPREPWPAFTSPLLYQCNFDQTGSAKELRYERTARGAGKAAMQPTNLQCLPTQRNTDPPDRALTDRAGT